MRWANLGRSYHWGTKSYDFSKKLAPFPEDIRDVCKRAVKAIIWKDIWGDGCGISDEEWGDEGVNWTSWKEDYGKAHLVMFILSSVILIGTLHDVQSLMLALSTTIRTRSVLLLTIPDGGRTRFLTHTINPMGSGHPHGSCGSLRALINNSISLNIVRTFHCMQLVCLISDYAVRVDLGMLLCSSSVVSHAIRNPYLFSFGPETS